MAESQGWLIDNQTEKLTNHQDEKLEVRQDEKLIENVRG